MADTKCLACREPRDLAFTRALCCCGKSVGVCAECSSCLHGLTPAEFVAKWEKLHGVLCEGGN
jgi:hypothetical protein